VASAGRSGTARHGAARRHYVASLAWPRRLAGPANDNYAPLDLRRVLPLAAGLALLTAALWSALS
jgi:hypothetical protein